MGEATEQYNWWTDPKNKEKVDEISWWNHPENRHIFPFPIAVVCEDGKYWCATSTEETEKLIGTIGGCSQADSKQEAIDRYFEMIRFHFDHLNEQNLSFRRWVPLRVGPWRHVGGTWLAIFGLHVYFRYGKNMKGGWYVPLTKLNISTYSEWTIYRNHMRKKKLKSMLKQKET